jgi:phospholipid/cholesterol/gamma-HCH transport system substrate-binding protein
MQGVDALAGGKDGGELFQAVKSFRELADNLDKRSNALILDGRRTLADISKAVNNLDRNPTRLLFGPSNSAQQEQAAPPRPPQAAAAQPTAARAEQPRPPRRRTAQ